MPDKIKIKGAKTHNLKNIDIEIPRDKLVVITGPSGSGKSSLAFDTIYAEGQRRYVESLSTYARQFLQSAEKPDVDQIEGLSPAIAIDQKTAPRNPRSTVGTSTEVYDFLRLLYAKIGVVSCPKCHKQVVKQTVSQMIDRISSLSIGSRFMIISPLVAGKKGEHKSVIEKIEKDGFLRMRINGQVMSIAEEIELDPKKKHNIDVVVDRLVVKNYAPTTEKLPSGKVIKEPSSDRVRLADSLEIALRTGDGFAVVVALSEDGKDIVDELRFSENFSCPDHPEVSFPEISPSTFSFNSPKGACQSCHGLGTTLEPSVDMIANDHLSLEEGAILPWSTQKGEGWQEKILTAYAKAHKIPLNKKWTKLTDKQKSLILYGSGDDNDEKYEISLEGGSFSGSYQSRFEGVIPNLVRRYSHSDSDISRRRLEEYMIEQDCQTCGGSRLRPEVLSIHISNNNIIEITELDIAQLVVFLQEASAGMSASNLIIAEPIFKEILNRLKFLIDVGLEYLTLSRRANTLSGGEAQRIRLATQIGSQLTGVLYVLDEPSIGLHQSDNDKLIQTMKRLRDLGNSVLVVEHDEDTMREADWIIDIGPKAGKHGGELVSEGVFDQICNDENSITGAYLSGRKCISIPKRRKHTKKYINIKGASDHNLQNIDVSIPLGVLTCVTGVSGSGKSSLINNTLVKAVRNELYGSKDLPGKHKEIKGIEHLDKIINIDQSSIGRTPRSNPATYTGLFTDIRDVFAAVPEAKLRGYKIGRFSFNVKGGRCEACGGDGMKKIEMYFLPDVYVPCEICNGRRYNQETLEITYRGKNIADVLEMTIEEAYEFFAAIPPARRKLQTLMDVGLDYIHLGQSATTLSGGEAQRIKLATELTKKSTSRTLYVLDEPTTGLHFSDIAKLLEVLHRLVDSGNTVLVIEHNMDIIKNADHIIDIGPKGGRDGGRVIATGTPEEVIKVKNSLTGQWLGKVLK